MPSYAPCSRPAVAARNRLFASIEAREKGLTSGATIPVLLFHDSPANSRRPHVDFESGDNRRYNGIIGGVPPDTHMQSLQVPAAAGRPKDPVGEGPGARVHLLDPHTVNQIAAGEVVERPASVVKELVENALDAGATRIEVDLAESGKARVRVSDDGCGMGEEDARLALERHATSKILSLEDLESVRSLGFRGEALPSIASVSRVTLRTATSDGLRFVIETEGGSTLQARGESGPRGTEIVVEDLFFNTPARLKFLKSDATELGACIEVLSKYGVAYPSVAFTVSHNGQTALQTDGGGDLLQAISAVWGRDLARGLAEIASDAAGIQVTGFISPPHLTRPTRAYQYVFVNGRPVRSRTLQAAIDQAYRSLTPERRFPAVVLLIEIAPSRVDVNVSPTKSEVKFQQEGAAFDAVFYAIRNALMQHGMIPSAEAIAAANEAIAGGWKGAGVEGWKVGGTEGRGEAGSGYFEAAIRAQAPIGALGGPSLSVPMPLPESPLPNERFPFAEMLDGLKVLGQAMNTFIVAETRNGIVIVDQHVAHERILYEYLCGLKGPSAIEVQPLLSPEALHVDKRAAILVVEQLGELKRIGFDLEPFGGESFLVRAVPAAIRGKSALKVLKDLIDELTEGTTVHKLSPTREQIWITSSCKMAVKAGDPLSLAEMEKLIVDLASTENPYLCPHGRPITITLRTEDLLRKFKRT